MSRCRWSYILLLVALGATSQGDSQPAYYPLAKGNRWQFADAQHQMVAVEDTLLPDGHTYRVLLDTWYHVREFQRIQGDSVFLPGLLLYDFSRSPGDTVIHTPNGYICVLLSKTISQVLGRELRQWIFGRSWDIFSGEIDSVTDSLGVTAIVNLEPPWQKVLTGAQIDGVEYGIISTVKANPGKRIPAQMVLMQNYPNPVNPTTSIRFMIPEQSHVRLTVCNILGEVVAIVLEETLQRGEHQVSFTAPNLASGIYVCRLSTNAGIATRQMILLK